MKSSTQPLLIKPSPRFPKINFRELWQEREVLYRFIWRDFKVRYKQTVLGYLWLILQPLALMVLYTLFFSYIARVPSNGIPYPIFLLSALIPWRFFSNSLSLGAGAIVGASGLLKRVYFPRLYLPISGVISGVIDVLVGFLVLLSVMLYFDIMPEAKILLVPVLIILLAGLSFASVLIISSLNAFFRDISRSIPIISQGWMYASPVVYPLSLVPESVLHLYVLNPVVGIIHSFRWATVGAPESPWGLLAYSVLATVTLLGIGLVMFRSFERNFVDVI
ncbi:MAG: ABC transporter permease [Nitrospirales bacterium]